MNLDNIVSINITTGSLQMAQKGFGVPLIIDLSLTENADLDRIITIGDLSDLPEQYDSESHMYTIAKTLLSQSPSVDKIKIARRFKSDKKITDTFDAICRMDNDFYGVLLAKTDDNAAYIKEAKELAGLIALQPLMLGLDVNKDSKAIASDLSTIKNKRTFCIHSDKQCLAAAWMGKMLAQPPGLSTWAFQTLVGIASRGYTTTEIDNFKKTHTNYYTTISDAGVTLDGRMASGEFIDTVRGLDWLQIRMQERLFRVMMINKKVPYTLKGIDIVRSEILGQLQEAIERGVLAPEPEPTVSIPTPDQINKTDRQARKLPNVKFSGRLQGAIHHITIDGRVSP